MAIRVCEGISASIFKIQCYTFSQESSKTFWRITSNEEESSTGTVTAFKWGQDLEQEFGRDNEDISRNFHCKICGCSMNIYSVDCKNITPENCSNWSAYSVQQNLHQNEKSNYLDVIMYWRDKKIIFEIQRELRSVEPAIKINPAFQKNVTKQIWNTCGIE